MPAVSATSALGKSWAVIMVMGSPFRCIDRKVLRFTFFRWFAVDAPIGECELCRNCHCDDSALATNNVGLVEEDNAEQRARDLMTADGIAGKVGC